MGTPDVVAEYQLPLGSAQGAGRPFATGESLASPVVRVEREHMVQLSAMTPDAGAACARLLLEYEEQAEAARWVVLAVVEIGGSLREQSLHAGLAGLAGRALRFRVRRADTADRTVAITGWRICAAERAGRLNALADYDVRLANEVQNFSGAAYTHAMYGRRIEAEGGHGEVAQAPASRTDLAARAADLLREAMFRLDALVAEPGERSYDYANRALGALLPTEPPDFLARAKARSEAGPLRILSILSGAARIEEMMLAHCPGEVDLTLMDASPDLIRRAAGRLSATGERRRIHCMVGDVNAGFPAGEDYDVIVCVSALHHVADLEAVLSEVNARLKPDGEFWSVGEQVGRNGNRLWPGTLDAANAAFRQLPERLRRNANTWQVDAALSDHDFSTGCFEGIRSEELLDLLQAYLVPVHVDLRNAFLWRKVDATYCDNFVLDDPGDLQALRRLVAAEAVHWAMGGRGTELNGVYRKKCLR
ncbi:MAG: class I SAM-dependent methyltransferase [Burkholderiales bacterium]|nr:class I SAM-dependent methyltransferase [Burkholderiales bacterium]